MNTVTDFISKNPDIIRHRQMINAAIDAARAAFMDNLADGIMKGMGEGFHVRLRPNLATGKFGADPNGALIVVPPSRSALHEQPFEIWVEHIAKWVALVVGIEAKFGKPPLSPESQLILQRMNALLDQHSKASGYRYMKADPHTLWDGTEWPTGWHNLIDQIYDERMACLLETPIEQTVATVCDGIRTHIQLLEQVYAKASLPAVAGN